MGENSTIVQKYLESIASYEREFKKWEGRVDKILKLYRDDERSERNGTARFNILYSNTNILVPAVFAKTPKPDVSRRFRDQDPLGRVAGMLLERTLSFEIDSEGDYCQSLKNVVFDRFIGGRGQAWVRYEPRFTQMQPDGLEITEDADEAVEVLDWEHTPVDYVHWRDFGHTIARNWEEVTAVWRRVYMGRQSLIERFGEELGSQIPLDTTPEELRKYGVEVPNAQAAIYEIWDKTSGYACWVSKSMSKILDEKEDPLKLQNFWPCPRPLFGAITTDNLVPLPDYTFYQDQAEELNVLSDRIDGLIRALKVIGVYDNSTPELSRLFTEGENNTLIPVNNWSSFVEKQGLKGAIDIVDIYPIVQALNESYNAADKVIAHIYQLTGISDIIRGDTDANETASAQRIKASYGNLRLKSNQQEVARFASELLQIKAQIICNFYRPETILKAAGAEQLQPVDQQLIPQAMQLLKDSAMRTFRIDIEADSMVQLDEDKLKADRLEFISTVSGFLKEVSEAAATSPQIVPLAMEFLKFGAAGFNAGKQLEGIIDQTAEELKQAITQQQQNPKPDPEMMKLQMQQQMQQQQMQREAQLDQIRVQNEKELEQFKQQMQHAQITAQNQIEAQRATLEASNDAKLETMRQMHEAALEQSRQNMEILLNRLNNATKIEVAEIAAASVIDQDQIGGAEQASDNG